MNMKLTPRTTAVALLAVLILLLAPLAFGQIALLGQSRTLLPDGRTLLVGGSGSEGSPLATAFVVSPTDGLREKLTVGLNFPRAGHTATVLPDGTVFIFGGIGADGHVVATSELFDPSTNQFSILQDVIAVPRAYHTATLLTDGTLLFAGGIMEGGEFPDDVQFWDWRTRKGLSFQAFLTTPRQGHTATLLSDGTVRISGGTDHFGRQVSTSEIFDPVTKRFRFVGTPEGSSSLSGLAVAASIPEDGSTNVALGDPIALRFTGILNVLSARQDNFQLTDPNKTLISARVTAAEGGRLVFVLPSTPLEPGTNYVLDVSGATGVNGEVMPETTITFQTEGAPPDGSGADWIPNSTWTDNAGITKFQELPPLHAHAGVTALSGQVLKLNGWPLQHVTLEIDGKRTRTDATGRFLLSGLAAGHHVLWIDGGTASHDSAVYGIHEVGVTILPNKTNLLGYTIWMTRLDTAHAVNISSPTTTETVITNPLLPGLELHLPANTVITDRYGKVVRQISITPVPLNKPPFPLPVGVQVPIYFTIQPGGAYISVQNAGSGPHGARLIYPNAFNFKPGTPFNFWNYDADVKGWFIYGQGAVSADGRSVIPDPGVMIYEFTGAMVGGPSVAPPIGPPAGFPQPQAGEPVNLSTGQFIYTKTDLALPDVIPLSLTRTYIPNDSLSRAFGIGTTHDYDIFMVGDTWPYTYQELILPDGGRIRFDRISAGTSWDGAVYEHVSAGTPFYGALLSVNTDSTMPGFWQLVLKDGTIYTFPEASSSTTPFCQAIVGMRDRFGNRLTFTRDSACHLTKIASPNGRYINLTIDANGRVSQAVDSFGRTVQYAYDAAGRLTSVTDANGGVTTYTYEGHNWMLTIRDPRSIVYLTNQYDSFGRVIQQTNADGGTYQFSWTSTLNSTQAHFYNEAVDLRSSGCFGNNGMNRYNPSCLEGYMPLVQQVDITDPRGYVRRVVFGPTGYPTSDTHALGQPNQQTLTYAYYADNTLQSVTDALGRVTSFDYDAVGNLIRLTRLDGTAAAVTSTFVHQGPFAQLSSITDPLNNTTSFSFDPSGNLNAVTDPLNHQTTFAYDGLGRITSVTDQLNHTTLFGYLGADLVTVTDPLGNVASNFTDAAGRVIAAADAQGNTTRYQYNPLNLLTQITDPQGNSTSFTYDGNGNLLSLTDALNHATSWTYDNMDRPATRTDPLSRSESYLYDLNGNVASTTDRKGQVTSVTYDALNRATMVGYNTQVNGGNTTYESTITYTYDAGNRMTQAVDTAGGTIIEAYDNLDRLTTETTPQGSISHGYDNAGRRTTMQVAGQPQLSYSYDNADRLTQITQGTSSVGFTYDSIDRRSSLTLPNGIIVSYAYDKDSRVAGITYQFGSNTLGNLSYTYDSLGRRTQAGGSFANTGLPGAISSATYDAANELTNWNGTPISYDLNGNMLGDGTNAFSWNARNQVATLNSVSLQYDALGRRTRNAAGTSFLYDGANSTQELSGSTPTANIWTGGVDEFFQRSDANGTVAPLADPLGNIIALVSNSGAIVTSYFYDPYGNTALAGAASSNASQYTGRENESNELYFYRARYYSPLFGRFVSEDPFGFVGSGPNFYAYVADDPINYLDPFGLDQDSFGWLLLRDVGTAAEAFTDTLTLGSASRLNDAIGNGGVVDRCGIGHKLATASGILASIALGGEMGLEAGEANAGKSGFEFSHWVPERAYVWVEENLGINIGRGRSLWNGNYVSQRFHYLTDIYRYPSPAGALLRWGPKFPPVIQQVLRTPWVYPGLGIGGLYGGAGAMAGRNCGCH